VALVVVLVPESRTRDLFIALTAGVYLPISFVLYIVQRRDPTPPNPVWMAVTLVDIAMVATVQALFPRLSVAFLALTAIVVVSAVLLGVRWAVLVAIAASLALLSAITVGGTGQPSAFAAVMGSCLLAGMACLIGRQAEGERMAAERSRKLAAAIASVNSSLDLTEVLSRLCEAAREAMAAAFSVVMIREDSRLRFGAGSHHPDELPKADLLLDSLMREPPELRPGTVRALFTKEPVTIEDVSTDPTTVMVRGVAHQLGIRAAGSIPIMRGGDAVGVLNVYLPRQHAFRPEELQFLVALAEHAGIAMERARLYAHERETADRLRELDRVRSEFVATVSHELRTPLTAIQGFALTLQNQWRTFPDSVREELLERLGDNARSLEHMITHLMDFGRLERGEFELQPARHDVGGLVRRVVANMVHAMSGHDVVTRLEPGVTATVDRFAFDRILGNLLSNAAKFSSPGKAIEITVCDVGGDAVVSVRDHGPGIPATEFDRIFERFYRGPAIKRGTGIGLAVAKDLAELHGGRVEVVNAVGGGALFTVVLPAAGPAREGSELVEAPAEA
jgi:signal transduction histidine kinase